MRSDEEVLNLILSYANKDENIRTVVMNGSRVNANIVPDKMQDFDVVYFVRDPGPLIHNLELPPFFGELAILQLPDEMGDSPGDLAENYAYLMQFTDGSRIDLSIRPLAALDKIGEDSLSVVLLDKDGAAPKLPPPSEDSYLPKPPSEKQYDECCNEFWWLAPYVSKALWRDAQGQRELVNAQFFLELRRVELRKMLNWFYGVKYNYKKASGKLGKRWQAEFGPELWALLEQSYAGSQPVDIWRALGAMGDLFRTAAKAVATHHGYTYPSEDDERVSVLVREMKRKG